MQQQAGRSMTVPGSCPYKQKAQQAAAACTMLHPQKEKQAWGPAVACDSGDAWLHDHLGACLTQYLEADMAVVHSVNMVGIRCFCCSKRLLDVRQYVAAAIFGVGVSVTPPACCAVLCCAAMHAVLFVCCLCAASNIMQLPPACCMRTRPPSSCLLTAWTHSCPR
jgi:hypothetical protein